MKLAGAYINDETYERLVALAAANSRTLAGQCRHLYDRALKGDLVVPDASKRPFPPPQTEGKKVKAASAESNKPPEFIIGWLPIDQIPRDGTEVLVWTKEMAKPQQAWYEPTGAVLKHFTHFHYIPPVPVTPQRTNPIDP